MLCALKRGGNRWLENKQVGGGGGQLGTTCTRSGPFTVRGKGDNEKAGKLRKQGKPVGKASRGLVQNGEHAIQTQMEGKDLRPLRI